MEYEPISAIDLMERATDTVFEHIVQEIHFEGEVLVFCGPGNNGGDGLALARMLSYCQSHFAVKVFLLDFGKGLSGSSKINFDRLLKSTSITPVFIHSADDIPPISKEALVVDALFGSGLNRLLEGLAAELIIKINQSGARVLSIDIPSGLMGDDNSTNIPDHIIKATETVTFQFPKLSFLFPEHDQHVGKWTVKDIGLSKQAIAEIQTNCYLSDQNEVNRLIKPRSKFSHKGTFGHALLIAGSYGKMGAAVLGAKACLRSGVGLLTMHVPHNGYQIIQTTIPEAIASIDESDLMFTGVDQTETYSAIGVGPAIGQKVNTKRALKKLIGDVDSPMVIDADAINILGENRDWLEGLPHESILTPHPKEFERLCGATSNSYERMNLAVSFAQQYQVILVLKGANTMIVNSKGDVWFNSTGNQGMATAGSGDVLTGIILALLAGGYLPFDAARLGVYVHGLSGDVAAIKQGFEALIASDIIDNLGEAFKLIHKSGESS